MTLKFYQRSLSAVALTTLVAFLLRMIGLAQVPPRWDEGWSVAHASLNLVDLFTITSADVHPPLFYVLLGTWQHLVGTNLFADRTLAVMMSLPSVALLYAVAMRWGKRPRLALVATLLMSWLPLSVYYSAVIRMYALAPTLVLLATWAALRLTSPGAHSSRWHVVAFVIGAVGAMLTLYHAAWALVALGIYVLAVTLARRMSFKALKIFVIGIAISIVLYIPWAVYAIPQLLGRAASGSENTAQRYPLSYFLRLGVEGLAMARSAGQAGLWAMGGVVAAGLVAFVVGTLRQRRAGTAPSHFPHVIVNGLMQLTLPLLTLLFTIAGVAAGARNWTFNERMLICAAPSLALLLAWSFDKLSNQSRALAGVGVVVLFGVYLNTSANFVYQKTLEVFDPYDPHTYKQHIAPNAQTNDIVFFNVLSPAGFYALDRSPADPSWSYALTWDPVIEPVERWQERMLHAAQTHARIWVVLYRGLAGRNGDLRGWLDTHFYPAQAAWGEEEVFYGLYGAPRESLNPVPGLPIRWKIGGVPDLQLVQAELPSAVHAGDILPVGLIWRANSPLSKNDKIFIHAFDMSGALIAQHDAQPLNDLRPMTTLPTGVDVEDHHGLALPAGFTGRLRVVMGLYDPATNRRIPIDRGDDAFDLGWVDVTKP